MGTFPLLILNNSAPLTTTTKAIVKIRIRTGTPRINSMYVLEIVLANLFLDILPMPEIKPRNNAILARGEERNYIKDYPQDLYIYIHKTKEDVPLISYEWFPKRVKKITNNFEYPMFPEDFAYYLLNDNDTLILVSASKNFFKNLKFSISNKHLSTAKSNGKLEFIVSSFAKNCGYRDLKTNFECNIYKPLISKNLITSFE